MRRHLPITDAPCCAWTVDEFPPPVASSGKDNTIPCAAGHHLMEGRWLRNQTFLDSYSRFWWHGGGNPRAYTFWAASAIYERYTVTGGVDLVRELFPDLVHNYHEPNYTRPPQTPFIRWFQDTGRVAHGAFGPVNIRVARHLERV